MPLTSTLCPRIAQRRKLSQSAEEHCFPWLLKIQDRDSHWSHRKNPASAILLTGMVLKVTEFALIDIFLPLDPFSAASIIIFRCSPPHPNFPRGQLTCLCFSPSRSTTSPPAQTCHSRPTSLRRTDLFVPLSSPPRVSQVVNSCSEHIPHDHHNVLLLRPSCTG
jgi:hypothetical protein